MGKYFTAIVLTILGWWLHNGSPAHASGVLWFLGAALYSLAGFVSIAGTLLLVFDREAFNKLFS